MRIKLLFNKRKEAGEKLFVAYIAAGDPGFKESLKIVDALVDAGVDIIELGVPFSDPLADGEANQLAAARALDAGMTPVKVLDLSYEIRRKHPDLPLVLFTYINPIAYSSEITFKDFCKKAVEVGIDAVLPLDLPPEERDMEWGEGETYNSTISDAAIPLVTLIAPTTTSQRIPLLTGTADSFIYYVSKEGVTGEGSSFSAGFADNIAEIRKSTNLPIVVGFGISTPEHVKAAIETGVDGVVVGSAIVRKVEEFANGKASIDDIREFVKSMTDAAKQS
jgi:tryptophan synthase alpha chain